MNVDELPFSAFASLFIYERSRTKIQAGEQICVDVCLVRMVSYLFRESSKQIEKKVREK